MVYSILGRVKTLLIWKVEFSTSNVPPFQSKNMGSFKPERTPKSKKNTFLSLYFALPKRWKNSLKSRTYISLYLLCFTKR